VPTDKSLGPHDGQGVAPIEAAAEKHQRESRRVISPVLLKLALRVERKLLPQE